MPPRTAAATRSSSGRSSSSTGPTLPVAPASFNVWQIAHGGVAPLVKSARPSAICVSPLAAAVAAPDIVAAKARTAAAKPMPRSTRTRPRSGDGHLDRMVGPAGVGVAASVLAALLGLDAAGRVGGAAGQDIAARRHAQRQRELPPGEAAEVGADERRVDPALPAIARYLDTLDRRAAAERHAA